MSYTYSELRDAYAELGVAPGRVVYVTSDLGHLRNFENSEKTATLEAHFGALMELLGSRGTLVVPTGSMNLCNTDTPFDLARTPSHRVGMLSEYVRTQPNARRSFHPFVSYGAIGAKAEEIMENVSRHAFGPESPEARMVGIDTLSISIGLYPRYSCSTAHHVELLMAVPYRYTKEYIHPVVRDGKVVREPFYQFVMYRDSDVERSFLERIVPQFEQEHEMRKIPVGRGFIYSYSMSQFVEAMARMIMEDTYVWCKHPPAIRPWRE